MATNIKPQPYGYRCASCNGSDVTTLALASWNVVTQRWQLEDVLDASEGTCAKCGEVHLRKAAPRSVDLRRAKRAEIRRLVGTLWPEWSAASVKGFEKNLDDEELDDALVDLRTHGRDDRLPGKQ